MIALVAALLMQDPEWAAEVHELRAASGLTFQPGATVAQQETCMETFERTGAWAQRKEDLLLRKQEATALRARIEASEVETEEGRDWKQATVSSLRFADRLIAIEIEEGDRYAHALTSANIVFCQPILISRPEDR